MYSFCAFMKNEIIVTIIFLACVASMQAKNYVVCVGVSDYPGKENDLFLSTNDAETIKDLYEKNGDAEVVSYTNEQATLNNITKVIKEMYNRASADDALVFFFSGHGLPGSFVCYDGVLKYEMLTDVMLESKAKCKMIFADACYSGKARQKVKEEKNSENSNVMFFLSSRSGEISIERKVGWHNSLFTAYLERGLRGGADANKDRVIIARELYLFVSKGVAEQSFKKQHPVMWGKFDDNMPVMNWKKE